METFERLGAPRDADAAAAVLRELGAPARAFPKGHGPLTKRETEVLSLLAEGCSNAEIAQRLYISRRTAEHHVARILAKLGLRNRAEVAAYALREQTRKSVAEIGISTDAARLARSDPQLSWKQSWIESSRRRRPRCSPGSHLTRASAGFAGRRARPSSFELGTGPPLLYVHGGLGGAYEMVPILAALAKTHRVLAVDRPGHGLADPFDYRGVDLLDHARTFLRRHPGCARAPDRRRGRQLDGRALVRRVRDRRSQPRVAPCARRRAVRDRAQAAPPDASVRTPAHRTMAWQARASRTRRGTGAGSSGTSSLSSIPRDCRRPAARRRRRAHATERREHAQLDCVCRRLAPPWLPTRADPRRALASVDDADASRSGPNTTPSDRQRKVRLSSRRIRTFASFDFPGQATFRGSTTQTPSSARSSASSRLSDGAGWTPLPSHERIDATDRDVVATAAPSCGPASCASASVRRALEGVPARDDLRQRRQGVRPIWAPEHEGSLRGFRLAADTSISPVAGPALAREEKRKPLRRRPQCPLARNAARHALGHVRGASPTLVCFPL